MSECLEGERKVEGSGRKEGRKGGGQGGKWIDWRNMIDEREGDVRRENRGRSRRWVPCVGV